MNETLDSLEKELGYRFNDKSLLEVALTHRSAGNNNNERLEYLGDALLGFIIAEALFRMHPDAAEGELTRLRAMLVKGDTLASLARKLDLGKFIRLGSGEKKSGGWRRRSILANTMEAVIGAIYLDSGMQACRDYVLDRYDEILHTVSPSTLVKDPKTRLQEFLQSRQLNLPLYTVIGEEGQAHAKIFTVECSVPDLSVNVQASGRSKRIAEQNAAQLALEGLEDSGRIG